MKVVLAEAKEMRAIEWIIWVFMLMIVLGAFYLCYLNQVG